LQITTETRVGLFVLAALGVFFYMTFKIGVFRWDRLNYKCYIVYFKDVSGLEKKADVKIAGVKVGWVETIELIDTDRARARIMVNKKYRLTENAHAIVRQEGLLGTKYLEISPGDPALPELKSDSPLARPGRSPVSVDDILYKMQEIATNVEDITDSFQNTFGGIKGKEQLQVGFENLMQAAEKFASFSDVLDRMILNNEENIGGILTDLRDFARDVKNIVPKIERLSEKLESDIFPSFKESIERISDVFDRDFDRVASKLEDTTKALEEAAFQARDGFKNVSSVAEKIDQGKGLIGKLINEEETYQDIKYAVRGVKNYLAKVEDLHVVFDSHGEFMFRPAENFPLEDTKGFFNIRIHPNDDFFYLFGIVNSVKGNLERRTYRSDWFDEKDNPLLTSELIAQGVPLPQPIGKANLIVRKPDNFKFNAQIAKLFSNVALRAGLIENSAGFGVDFEIPFKTDNFRWLTTFEAYDFKGRDRIGDSRPHLKWINRVFFFRNLYLNFGADDFVSRKNANGFFGGGIRFCDDDIKYLVAKLS